MEMLKCYNIERLCNIDQYILHKNTIYHLEQEMLNKYANERFFFSANEIPIGAKARRRF
jgi:hypothetical protein